MDRIEARRPGALFFPRKSQKCPKRGRDRPTGWHGPCPRGHAPRRRRVGRTEVDQYESAETTSPWAREPSAQMTGMLVPSLRNLTEPSQARMFAPPEWKLVRLNIPEACKVLAFP